MFFPVYKFIQSTSGTTRLIHSNAALVHSNTAAAIAVGRIIAALTTPVFALQTFKNLNNHSDDPSKVISVAGTVHMATFNAIITSQLTKQVAIAALRFPKIGMASAGLLGVALVKLYEDQHI